MDGVFITNYYFIKNQFLTKHTFYFSGVKKWKFFLKMKFDLLQRKDKSVMAVVNVNTTSASFEGIAYFHIVLYLRCRQDPLIVNKEL